MKRYVIIFIVLTIGLSACKPIIHKLAFFPDTSDLPGKLPDALEEIFLETEDHVSIQTYFIRHDSENILIYFHGNAGNISHRIPIFLKLHSFGLNVLGVSYRGYGKSGGRPSEKGIYLDGLTAFKYVTEKLQFKPEHVVVMGRSLGSTVAVHLSQVVPLKGVILVTPLTSAYDHAKAHGMGIFAYLGKGVFDNASKIRSLNCPLLIIHGTRDEVIPFELGKKLFDLAKCRKQFVEIPNGSHNDLEFVRPDLFWGSIKNFIAN